MKNEVRGLLVPVPDPRLLIVLNAGALGWEQTARSTEASRLTDPGCGRPLVFFIVNLCFHHKTSFTAMGPSLLSAPFLLSVTTFSGFDSLTGHSEQFL